MKLAVATPRHDENRWLGDYGSSLRDDALKLALLEENKLLPEAQNTLLSTLSEEAYGQRWLSTQETNALFLPGARWPNCRATGRRKPRCRPSRSLAIKRKPVTSTVIGWRRCR